RLLCYNICRYVSSEKPTDMSQGDTGTPIAEIGVTGFKSLANEQRIEIRPLTLLAGANSSGKSAIVQPLLLMKQTLEASFNPGALLLSGSNARFSSVEQLFWHADGDDVASEFSVTMKLDDGRSVRTAFGRATDAIPLKVLRSHWHGQDGDIQLVAGPTAFD